MASPQAISRLCAHLVKVYGKRADEHLGDDVAKEILFDDLSEFTDEEVIEGGRLCRREQENLFPDGHSVYAVILKYVRKAKENLKRERLAERRRLEQEERRQALDPGEITPELMAVNKQRIRLLTEGRIEEAAALGKLSLEDAVKQLPSGALLKAKRMWRDHHKKHFQQQADKTRIHKQLTKGYRRRRPEELTDDAGVEST